MRFHPYHLISKAIHTELYFISNQDKSTKEFVAKSYERYEFPSQKESDYNKFDVCIAYDALTSDESPLYLSLKKSTFPQSRT